MAGSKTDYLEDRLINHILRNTASTPPTTVYVALFTTAPSDAGGGTEVSGGSYARQVATFDTPSPAGQTQNTSEILFPTATANWGTITHWAIFDAVSAGNMLYWGDSIASKVVANGDAIRFAAGQLQIDED